MRNILVRGIVKRASEYRFEGQWISLALFKSLFENNYKFWELFMKSKIKKG